MKSQRTIYAAAVGIVVTALLLIGLRELTQDLREATMRAPWRGYAGPAIWFIGLGLVVGATAVAARLHYAVAAIPAGVVFLVYLPLLIDANVPSWYPEWLRETVLFGFSPAPFVVAGVLGFAAISRTVEGRWVPNLSTEAEPHRSPNLAP